MAKQATAELQPDGKYLVRHADGTEELLTEGQFKAQYELEGEDPKVKGEAKSDEGAGTSTEDVPPPKKSEQPDVPPAVQGTGGPTGTIITSNIDGGQIGTVGGDEDPPTLAKAHRPDTHDRDDAFLEDTGEFADEYCQAVDTELKRTEDKIKAVRAEMRKVDKQKEGERDFGPLRDAMHELAHGNSLLRTAHPATVRHDGPERLRPAPDAYDNISSGPGEECNYVEESTAEGRKQESRKAGR